MASDTLNTTSQKPPLLKLRLIQGNTAGHNIFQLNRPSFSSLNLLEITTFEKEKDVILKCPEIDGERKKFDILGGLRSGLVDLVDDDDDDGGEVVDLWGQEGDESKRSGKMTIPPKPSPEHYQVCTGMEVDSTKVFWKNHLQAGKSYTLRFSKDAGELYCFYPESVIESLGEDVPASECRIVERDMESSVSFKVYDDPAPPKLLARFDVEPKVCLRSGDPPFKIVYELSTDSDRAVTICISGTPFRNLNTVEQLAYVEDVETGEEVEFPAAFGCFDENPSTGFPGDEDFIEILPGGKWRYEHVLKEESNSEIGGLEELEPGREYRAQLAEKYIKKFMTWMYGKKEELLKGDGEERKRRWDQVDSLRQGSMPVEGLNDPVVFRVEE